MITLSQNAGLLLFCNCIVFIWLMNITSPDEDALIPCKIA